MLALRIRLMGAVFVAAFIVVPLLMTESFFVAAQDIKLHLASARILCDTLRVISDVSNSDVSAHCYVGDPLSGDGKVIQGAMLEHGIVDVTNTQLSPSQLPVVAKNGLITAQHYRDYTEWNAFKLATYSLFRPDFADKAKVKNFYVARWSDQDWIAEMAGLVMKGDVKIVVRGNEGEYLAMDASPQFYEKIFGTKVITNVAAFKGKVVGVISDSGVDIGIPSSKKLISYGERPAFVLVTDWADVGGSTEPPIPEGGKSKTMPKEK
jgi:hypothetical protein